MNVKTINVNLPDGPAQLTLRPGIKPMDAANEVLFTATRTVAADHVFAAGPGSIASALWAARQDAQISTWTDNINWATCISETFHLANLPSPTVHLQAGFENVATDFCDLAMVHLPRGRALQVELLQLAAAVLKQGSKLVFVGAKQEGVKSAIKAAREIFTHAGTVAQKAGYHVIFAQRPPGDFTLPILHFTHHEIQLNGETTTLVSCPGVFATGRLDGGAQALITSMAINVGSNVLDMGCGSGLVGLYAIKKGAAVTFTDVSARAVLSTHKTLAANGLNGTVVHTSGAETLPAAQFEVVYANPPFHRGYGVDFETTRYLIKQAHRALVPGGTLYLVANAFLKYQPWLEADFANVHVHYENRQFRVWQGTKS